jgi:ribosome-associated toxin RatA of RatAB toxin-antitoxin module
MFELVNDVEKYPDFLPWCRAVHVKSRDEKKIKATVDIAKSSYSQSFASLLRLQKDKSVEMHLLEGPFDKFKVSWLFEPVSETESKVIFDLDYKFSSRIVGMVAGSAIAEIAETLLGFVCQRADDIYGKED